MATIGELASESLPVEQTESIKLTKNSKGYGWEIKLLGIDTKRLEELNNIMITKFKTEVK